MSFKQHAIQDLDKMMNELGIQPSEVLAGLLLVTFAFFLLLITPVNPSWPLLILGWYGMISAGTATVLMAMLVSHRAKQEHRGK